MRTGSTTSKPPGRSLADVQDALSDIFQEPTAAVIERENSAFASLLKQSEGRWVLFGAGSLGRQVLTLLRENHIEPIAITDNSPECWGQSLAGIPVLSPTDAARLYGKNAVFLITIRNENHWFSQTVEQLERLGCRYVSSTDPLAWRFPGTLQPALLYDLPHKLYESADQVLCAAELWEDDISRAVYLDNVLLRSHGDRSWFTQPAPEQSYFLQGVFETTPADIFLDCGAFDGDTIRALLARQPEWAGIEAIEADPLSFAKLKHFVETLEPAVKERIHLHQCAVGAENGRIRFENTGKAASTIADEGGVEVNLATIDTLFSSTNLSIVKMDIEGAERDALLGGKNVIQRDNPILSVCVYHKQGDIWELPLLMREICPDSKLYLRTYGGDAIQTVAYAVPPRRVIRRENRPAS